MADNNPTRARILIIDDVEQVRNLLAELLVKHECVLAASAEAALDALSQNAFDLIISDINLPGISGLDLVPRILKSSPDSVVIMVSGEQTIEYAIEAMRVGAFDYITKPIDVRHVAAAVDRGLVHGRLLVEKRRYEEHLEELVRERTAEVEHLAYYDRLTDLPNRNLFLDRCTQALAAARRKVESVGVMLVALDRFKKITETLGHTAADALITSAAARLQTCICTGDTLARIDGDEFAILLLGIREASELAELATAIAQRFKQPFRVHDHDIYISTSSGISVFPENGSDPSTILRNAGAALYRAKQTGGNNYQFYAAEMNSQAIKRLTLETSLRQAITLDEFITYYQPILNLATNELVGAEALIRWRHPGEGLLSPASFIALAEDTGLIIDIGESIIRDACMQTRAWQDRGLARVRIAINVSARQLSQPSFLNGLVQMLSETRLDPMRVELELTETTMMQNSGAAADVLAQVRKLGVKVAVDDFGTGYSSLSYLKRLPIDTVKLDQSFVKGATIDPDDAALVMAIITLAHNLKLKVIAEGIETPEQLAFLRLLRCDEGQGFLFGKPMPPDVFESTIATHPRKAHALSTAHQNSPPLLKAVNE